MNHILFALSDAGREMLLPKLKTTALEAGQVLERPNTEIRSMYFLETGIAVVQAISAHETVATGLIGCEGATGVRLLLGGRQTPNATNMVTDGTALVGDGKAIRSALKHAEVRDLFERYSLAYFTQAEHTAISSTLATVNERVIRWLLMAHDRWSGNIIPITHEAISAMLGTRRAGVTTALHALADNGWINLLRGAIVILDRINLEKAAGHFYGIPEKEYVRLVGTYWPPYPKDNQGTLELAPVMRT